MGHWLGSLALLLTGCRGTLSPLSNKLDIGTEPYVVFVADGEDGLGDLFASTPQGGPAFQTTFTRVDERTPALAADGIRLAFLRTRAPGDSRSAAVVVLNLLNGAEREVRLNRSPEGVQLAWSPDGRRVLLRSQAQLLMTAAPPEVMALVPVAAAERPAAESAFSVLLGQPTGATVVPCPNARGVCLRLEDGTTALLDSLGANALGWAGDSVAYRSGEEWLVRPLGGGRSRALRWDGVRHVRGLSWFGGSAGP